MRPLRSQHRRLDASLILLLVGGLLLLSSLLWPAAADAQWPHWGGPGSNFTVPAPPLAESWPEGGPRELWRHPFGDGNSSIAIADGTLYTLVRRQDAEGIVALDAATGKIRWEVSEPAALYSSFNPQFGPGPNSTPLVADGRVFATGIRARLLALDAATGKQLWVRDLWQEFSAPPPPRGYAGSPAAWKSSVIVAVHEPGPALVAFDQASGKLLWKSPPLPYAYSSPIVATLGGRPQVILFAADDVAGFDPDTGQLLWKHPHSTLYQVNAMTPLVVDGDLLFTSSAYDAGSRALRISFEGDQAKVEEIWYTRRLKIHHGTAVTIDGVIYGSSGDFGPAFLMGVKKESGEVLFQERGFAKANVLALGKNLLILDEDGNLAVATPGPEGLEIHRRAQILHSRAWTAPSLDGSILYVRDRKEIVALDLGPAPAKPAAPAKPEAPVPEAPVPEAPVPETTTR